MDIQRFEKLVGEAIDKLPEEFRERLENIDIVVADTPTRAQLKTLKEKHGHSLLGLYEGVPLTERTHDYGFVVPDKITVFQKSIEAMCRSDTQIVTEIEKVVRHEIAHHFGISDDRLEELGRY
jgi:predicted Zn-dependent protease with MMP-like domain